MRTLVYTLTCILLLLSFQSCSKNTPQKAAFDYTEYLKDGDYKSFVDHIYFEQSEDNEAQKEEYLALIEDKYKEEINKHKGIEKYKIIEEDIKEDRADIVILCFYKDGETEEFYYNLVKRENKWLMDFNK